MSVHVQLLNTIRQILHIHFTGENKNKARLLFTELNQCQHTRYMCTWRETTQNDAVHPDSRHFEEIHVVDIKCAVDGETLYIRH